MQTSSTASGQLITSQIAEMVLRPLFVSLPTPRGVDAEALMDGYLIALEGLNANALKSVVIHLVKGTWHEEVKFCPRPPELANMVRDEQRRVEAANRERLPAPAVVSQPFKDLRVTHRLRSEELQRAGFTFHARCESHEAFAALAKRRAIPVGSVHLWAIDEVWAPKQVKVSAPPARENEIPFEDEAAA